MEVLAFVGFIFLAGLLFYLLLIIMVFINDTVVINNVVKQTRFYKEYMKKQNKKFRR